MTASLEIVSRFLVEIFTTDRQLEKNKPHTSYTTAHRAGREITIEEQENITLDHRTAHGLVTKHIRVTRYIQPSGLWKLTRFDGSVIRFIESGRIPCARQLRAMRRADEISEGTYIASLDMLANQNDEDLQPARM